MRADERFGADDLRLSGDNSVRCAECRCSSGSRWVGWGAYRIDAPELDEPPMLAFFCPACTNREFGPGYSRRV